MATESARAISLTAGAAIAQRRLVGVTTAGEIIQSAAETIDSVGVSLEAAAAQGDVIPVAVPDGGKVEIESGAAITAGDALESDATGRAITHGGATARIIGYALEAAGGAGEFPTVLFLKGAGV
jgi:hypothetical protein